eukprot:jgi/Psemu1/222385/e_gw1.1213.13.1
MQSSAQTNRKHVDSAFVGEPPKKVVDRVESLTFVIYNFKDRKETQGECIMSPILRAHGYEWKVQVHPRDHKGGDGNNVGCYLRQDQAKVSAIFSIRCKRAKYTSTIRAFNPNEKKIAWGWKNFAKRDDILDYYLEDDGSLVIIVDIQIAVEDKKVWYPKELQSETFLVEQYHQALHTGDVTFTLDEGTNIFHAHRIILSTRAKSLFDIADEYDIEQSIPIVGVREEIFRALLQCIYTIEVPINLMEKDEEVAKEVLLVADRFGCTHLKLYAESILVDKFLGAESAASLLLLGDSHSSALLKEASMDIFVRFPKEVMKSKDWPAIEESHELHVELMKYYHFGFVDHESDSPHRRLGVAAIRDELIKDVSNSIDLELLDGSRELLVERLNNLKSTKGEGRLVQAAKRLRR